MAASGSSDSRATCAPSTSRRDPAWSSRPKRGRSAGVPSIGIGEAGLALVGDSAIFGATAPLVGSRYRLQATANVGGLQYASVLADYRRYVMPVRPYTVALRVVHTGRYGGDASDFRLRDAYVGAPTLVRGYGAREVMESECPFGQRRLPGPEPAARQPRRRRQARSARAALERGDRVVSRALRSAAGRRLRVCRRRHGMGRGGSVRTARLRRQVRAQPRRRRARQRVRPDRRGHRGEAVRSSAHGVGVRVRPATGFLDERQPSV